MITVWHQSTARAIWMHRIRLLSYSSRGTLMSYGDHSSSAASSRTRLLLGIENGQHVTETFALFLFSKLLNMLSSRLWLVDVWECADALHFLGMFFGLRTSGGLFWRRGESLAAFLYLQRKISDHKINVYISLTNNMYYVYNTFTNKFK